MTAATQRASFGKALPAIAVGGGLAGAAFALELARNGCRAIVLERTSGPSHKVCGEFLSQDAQIALRYFGIDVHELGATSIARVRLVRGERRALAPLPFLAAGLSRRRLDEALLREAEHAGAFVIRGVHVTGIESSDDAITVRTEGYAWQAAAVAIATGKHCLRGLARRPSPTVGFKIHLEPTAAARELIEIVQLAFFRGGYIGACLVEGGILSLGWVMQDHLLRTVGSSWSAQSLHLSRQSTLVGDLLSGSKPCFAKPTATAAIPYGYLRKSSTSPLIFFVGDQLAVVPSFTGDGIAIALHTGLAAARAVLAGELAEQYQLELVGRLRRQFRLTGTVGRLLETTATSPIMVAAAAALPSIVTRIAAATRFAAFPPK